MDFEGNMDKATPWHWYETYFAFPQRGHIVNVNHIPSDNHHKHATLHKNSKGYHWIVYPSGDRVEVDGFPYWSKT